MTGSQRSSMSAWTTDQDARRAIYAEVQRRVATDAPMVFLHLNEQAAALQGWNQRYLQLSRGRFDGTVTQLQIDGVGLFVEDLHQTLHQTGWVREDVFAVGVPLLLEGDTQFCGQPTDGSKLHVFSGAEGFEFRSPERHIMVCVEIDRARMRNLSPEGVVSTASANRVITNADNTRFLLQGDAVIVRQGGTGADGAPLPRLEFRGEALDVQLDPDRVISDQPVELRRGEDRLTADTLDYSGIDRVARFKGRVRVRLQP